MYLSVRFPLHFRDSDRSRFSTRTSCRFSFRILNRGCIRRMCQHEFNVFAGFTFFLTKANNNTPHLYLQGKLIRYQKSFKFIGITFDQSLSFKDHINDISTRCRKRLNLIKAIRGQEWGANPKTLLYTYKTYIRPVLEYGCILFAHANKDLL